MERDLSGRTPTLQEFVLAVLALVCNKKNYFMKIEFNVDPNLNYMSVMSDFKENSSRLFHKKVFGVYLIYLKEKS